MSEEAATAEAATAEGSEETSQATEQLTKENSSAETGLVQDPKPAAQPLGGQEPKVSDWLADLPEELRDHPSVAKYNGDKEKTVKGLIEAQKLIGQKRLEQPSEDWTDEQYLEWAKNLPGYPESPDKYDLKRPDLPEGMSYDEESEAKFRELFHGSGLTQKQVGKIFDAYNEMQVSRYQSMSQQAQEESAKNIEAMQKEWGQDYDRKILDATNAAKVYGGQELIDVLNERGLGANPVVVKALANIGAALKEDEALGNYNPEGFASTPTAAKAQIQELRADSDFMAKYNGRDGKEAMNEARKRMEKLYQIANPE